MRLIVLFCVALGARAWTQSDRDEALKVVDSYGFPRLEAWNRMTPKMLQTVLKTYVATVSPDAFEHFDAKAIEVVYTAVSAINNCEMCLSFHAAALGPAGLPAEDIAEILAGGLPKDAETRKLVIGAKYAMAHKGVLLAREKVHLAALGITPEMFVELNFLAAFMSAHNQNYIHLISEGLELEGFLQQVGPFAGTVYPKVKDEV